MTTAVSTAAAQSPVRQPAVEWQNAGHTVALVLSSNGRDKYRVTRAADAITCTCTAASFGRQCRHVKQVQQFIAAEAMRVAAIRATQDAGLRYCQYCHINPARQCGNYCSDACHAAAASPVIPMVVEDAEYAPHALCVRCGVVYRWSDASPLLCRNCGQSARVAA